MVNNNGTLDLNSGTLNMGAGGTHTGLFNVANGTALNFSGGAHNLGDGATLSGIGTIGFTGGTLNLTGAGTGTTIAPNTTFSLSGQTLGGTGKLTNQGRLNLAAGTISGSLINQANLNVSGATVINNGLTQQSGVITVASGILTVNGTGLDWQGGTLAGTGTYAPNALSLTTAGTRVLNGPTINVPSAFNLTGGSLNIQGGGLTVGGASTIHPGATLSVSGGTFTPSGAFNNNNAFNVNAGTVNLPAGGASTGAFTVQGALNFSGGTHALNAGSSVGGTGTVGISGATTTVNVNTPLSLPNLNFSSGTIAGSAPLTIPGAFNWNGGNSTNSGLLTTGGASAISGTGAKSLGGGWTNSGTATLTGGALTVNGLLSTSGTVNVSNSMLSVIGVNETAGLITIAPGSTLASTGTVSIAGTLQGSTGGALNAAGQIVAVTSTGTLDVNGGIVTAATVLNSGLLKGLGTVSANINNDGTVSPGASPGIMTINGNYTQGSTGILNVDVNGTTPGTQYDRLVVTGTAALNGTLNISTGDFVPAAGDSFTIVQATGGMSGTFATINPPASTLIANYQSTAFVLTEPGATPTPSLGASRSSTPSNLSTDIIVSEERRQEKVAANLNPATTEDKRPERAPICQ